MRIKCRIIRKSLFCGWQLANQNRNRLLRLGSQNILRTFRRLIQSPSKSYLETAAAFQKCRWWALWQMAHANKIQRNRKHSFWCVRLPRHNTTPVVSKCSKLKFDADTDIAERTIMITLKLETWRPAVGREKESRIVSLSLPLPRALLSASALWGEEIVDGDEARGDNLFQCQLELLLNVLAELCVQTWDVFGRFSLSLSVSPFFFFTGAAEGLSSDSSRVRAHTQWWTQSGLHFLLRSETFPTWRWLMSLFPPQTSLLRVGGNQEAVCH